MECARVHSIFGRREERMSEKMKIFQKIQYVTVGIAFASIVLPLIFWKKIPEKIPQHYNEVGNVDIWSDKTSLILLFFVILFLLGDMQSSWKMVPASVFDSDIFTFYLVYLQEPERDNTKKRAEKGICKTGKGAGRRGGILSD